MQALFIILLYSSSVFAQEFLNHKLIKESFEVTAEITQKCQKPPCLFISLGRSPVMISEILKREQVPNIDLPLSSFRYNINAEGISDLNNSAYYESGYKLSPDAEQKLFKHFDDVFDFHRIDITKYREIFLIDYAITGQSLMSTHQYLEKYIQEEQLNTKLRSIAMANYGQMEAIHLMAHTQKVDVEMVWLKSRGQLDPLMRGEEFQDFARFQSYHLKRQSKFMLNPSYEEFKTNVNKEIDQYLVKASKPRKNLLQKCLNFLR